MNVRKVIIIIGFSVAVGIALYARFYSFYDTVAFRGDQAGDLYIARGIIENNWRPPVGPFLSVSNFQTPPTYYYILAGFYSVLRTPEAITFAFAFMNVAVMGCMVSVAALLMDDIAGIIMAFLFATSYVMTVESRQIWAPHTLTLFLSISLLLLLNAFRRRSFVFYLLSVACYAVALSIYVSPILLLPYYIVMGVRFIRNMMKTNYLVSFGIVLFCLTICAFPFFAPFMVYEVKHGFPTYGALVSQSFGPPAGFIATVRLIIRYGRAFIDNIFGLYRDDFHIRAGVILIFEGAFALWVLLPIGLGNYLRSKSDRYYRAVTDFVPLWPLVFGSLLLLFFRHDLEVYGLNVFLPFFFLLLTLALRLAFASKQPVIVASAICVMIVYLITNIWSIQSDLIRYPRRDVALASSVAFTIARESARANISTGDMTVLAYRYPNIYTNYILYPFLYYLRDYAHYTMPLVSPGNDIDRKVLDRPNTPYVYLICVWYPTVDAAEGNCMSYFLKHNPLYGKINKPVNFGYAVLMTFQKISAN
ncbi:MAG TPA: hypothetical protein VMR81_01850 [Patescibacteria group bacterium]|nr:hypothetical protein [Patescibacteria group bacterium]